MRAATFIGLLSCILHLAKADFPIPRCSYGNTTCIKNVINEVIAKYHKGLPEIQLSSVDPMYIKEFNIVPNKGSNLDLKTTFFNSEVRGIKDATAYEVKGFGRDMTKRHSVSFKHPLVGIFGDYRADGQLSIIPLKVQGKGNVNLTGLHWTLSFNGEPEVRNGKTYLKIKNFALKENHIDSCKFRFGNLFGSLGQALNEFLDESWRDLYQEINGKIFSNFRVILKNIIQKVFNSTPYDELFEGEVDENDDAVEGVTTNPSEGMLVKDDFGVTETMLSDS